MRLELLGAIGLTALLAAACGGQDNGSDLGSAATSTGGGVFGAGGAAPGAGGSGNAGIPGGAGQATSGNGGSLPGAGGFQPGGGGFQPGGGGTPSGGGQVGAGGTGTVVCPATEPTNGDACTGRGTCNFGSTVCACRRVNGGTTRAWNCFSVPDGGFTRPDGGFTTGDGGFTRPTTCTQASDCTGGNVCCGFQRGAFCISSANCTQFGGTPKP